MLADDLKLKLACLLRRAGLSRTPRPVLLCLAAALALLLGLALWRFWPGGEPLPAEEADFQLVAQEEALAGEDIVVDVEGAVRNPGLYTLPADSRAGDAVEAAGGLSPKALAGGVNLAQPLEDGQQLTVPSKGGEGQASGTEGSAGAQAAAGGLVNINTASAQELQELSGIGPALSQRIVEYRSANGPFSSVEELTEVSGIGEAILERLRGQVSVGA